MRRKIMLIVLGVLFISSVLAVVPTMYDYNPAFVFESSRRYLNLSDFNLSGDFGNNLITFDDINKLALGEKVVFDATRLSLMEDEGFVFLTKLYENDYIGVGFGNFRMGINLRTDDHLSLNLPVEMMRVLFGDVDFNENIEKSFSMFKGDVSIQTGALLGYGFRIKGVRVNFGVEAGAYMPFISFDRNSLVDFYYKANEDTATLEMGLSGEQKFYSSFSSLDSVEYSNELQNNMGYYVNVGVETSFRILRNPLVIAMAVKNISLVPAKAKYYGYATVSYEASLVNLQLNTTDPKLEFPEGDLEELDEATDVTVPYELNLFASYKFMIFNFALYGKYVPDINLGEVGGYVSLWDVLWFNASKLDSLWKKEIGLNFDLRLLRLTAAVGVIDAGGLFNVDPAKMTGFSIGLGFGLGF